MGPIYKTRIFGKKVPILAAPRTCTSPNAKGTTYDKSEFFLQNLYGITEVKKMSKIYVRMSTTNIHLFQFDCRYIRTCTNHKPTKISNTTNTILLPYQEKNSNWVAILSTIKSTARDETIRCSSKWFISTHPPHTNSKSGVDQSQVRNLHTTHSCPLKKLILKFSYRKKIHVSVQVASKIKHVVTK